MKFCGATYCDFVVWREEEVKILRIYPGEQFMATILEKVISFFKFGVLLELIGKWYSKAPVNGSSQPRNSRCSERMWCYCKQGEEGQMIACDNEECSIVVSHKLPPDH